MQVFVATELTSFEDRVAGRVAPKDSAETSLDGGLLVETFLLLFYEWSATKTRVR